MLMLPHEAHPTHDYVTHGAAPRLVPETLRLSPSKKRHECSNPREIPMRGEDMTWDGDGPGTMVSQSFSTVSVPSSASVIPSAWATFPGPEAIR